jgi:type II secretory pathway component PulF
LPVFVYRASDQRGQAIEGVMEAADTRAVVERLQRDAYFPIRIAAQEERRRFLGLSWSSVLGQGRVRARDLVALTHQLATLLEAGLPLDRALGILEELAASPRLRTITGDVLRSVHGGTTLADALAKHHPRPFSRLYINMVRAGEKGGVLEPTLKRLADFLEESLAFREALVSALIYPVLLSLAGAGAVLFLMTFVIPRFADIFSDLGQTIPLSTQVLLSVSGWLRRYWWLLVLAGFAALLAGRLWVSTAGGRVTADRAILRLPLAGEVALKSQVARCVRVLGTLLRSGVPMLAALTVVREMMGNVVLAQAVDRLADGVRRGAGLATPMRESGAFPPLAQHMVRVGEETGRLEEMLLKVAETLEGDVRKLVRRLTGLLEPMIILVMGLLVGFIVVAMLMAIFSISDIPL